MTSTLRDWSDWRDRSSATDPQAICFVGLDGWRRVRDRHAVAGWVTGGFGGRPAYLMPSTSGLNAHCNLADLTAHLRRALRGP